MLLCPLSFLDIEPLSQKCGEHGKLTDNNSELTEYFPTYKDVSRSSRTVLVKRSLLTLDVKFLYHLQSTPFCTNTAVPAFLPCLEASLEVPFWNCVKYPLRFLLNLFSGVESSTLHPKLQLGEEEKVTGGQIG